MIDDPELRKKLPSLLLDDNFVDQLMKGLTEFAKEELDEVTPLYKTFQENIKDKDINGDTIIEMLTTSILKERKERLDDVATVFNVIEPILKQNIVQQKQISKLLRLATLKNGDKETEIEQLKKEIEDAKKQVSDISQDKVLKFLRRKYDDEVNDTSHD